MLKLSSKSFVKSSLLYPSYIPNLKLSAYRDCIIKNESFVRRFSKIEKLKKNKNGGSDAYFTPKETLKFLNDELIIMDNPQKGYIKAFMVVACGVGLLTVSYCFKKVLNYSITSWPIVIGCGLVGIYTLSWLWNASSVMSRLIKRITLCADGKHAILYVNRFGLFSRKQKVDIASLSTPADMNAIVIIRRLGYPILAGDDMFIVPRKGQIIVPEVVPRVLNGIYIDTANKEEYHTRHNR